MRKQATMSSLKAAEKVLRDAGEPLHCKEITQRILEQQLWRTEGKTPAATVYSNLIKHIAAQGDQAVFIKAGPSIFGLTHPGPAKSGSNKAEVQKPSIAARVSKFAPPQSSLSFTEAAERVLTEEKGKQPLHYKEITQRALEKGLLVTEGKTPEATMYSMILTENERRRKRGEQARFVKLGKGFVGLSRWLGKGLAFQIATHNAAIRKKLHKQLLAIPPADFEELVGQVLVALGFDSVRVTKTSGDGGIDVRGKLVVGDVIKTRMAVQAKRWKANVQSPVVQQVRGSLGAHEHGLIITTSNFSKGAREEADRPDATPVALMNGEQFVGLLIEHGIGVHRTAHELIEIAPHENKEES